jgi:acyl-CoA thioesterase-1
MLNGTIPRSAATRRAWPVWVLVLFGATLAGGAFAAESMRTILFFGDSLTAGYGLDDPASEAYPALIQRKLEVEHLGWRAVNAGVSGETSAGGLRRIDWVLQQHVNLFVLALGANDGLRGIDPAVTESNLDQILRRVRTKNPQAKLVVAGMEMPPTMGNTFTQRYRAAFANVARKYDAVFLPFLLEGVAGHRDLNQTDAVHPTAAGHRVMAEHVWKTLRPLL